MSRSMYVVDSYFTESYSLDGALDEAMDYAGYDSAYSEFEPV